MTRRPTILLLAILWIGHAGGCAGRNADGTWTRLADLPLAVSNNAVCARTRSDGSWVAYSFMGITDPDDVTTITPRCHAYDSRLETWRRIADAPLFEGRARIAANAVTIDGRVFLVGGYTVDPETHAEATDPRLLEYLPEEDRFVERAPPPVPVDDTVVGVWQDRYLYLVSGWHGPEKTNTTAVQVYDAERDAWQMATPIPAPTPGLFGHTGGVAGRLLLYMDGAAIERTDDGRRFVINDRAFAASLNTRDPTELEWRELGPHPGEPTYRAAPTPGGVDRLVVLGGTQNPYNISGVGYDARPSRPLDQVLSFDPDAISDRPGGGWALIEPSGSRPPTMDHRALAPTPDGLLVVGGMTAPGITTPGVWLLELKR